MVVIDFNMFAAKNPETGERFIDYVQRTNMSWSSIENGMRLATAIEKDRNSKNPKLG